MTGRFLRAVDSWPRRHRGLAAALAGVLLAILGLLAPLGCSTTVIPPARVADPVEVYLVDHGRTPSLVLPRPEGGMARWVYGDWDWYALGKQNLIINGLPAMLWPTHGALGRETLAVESSTDAQWVSLEIAVTVRNIYPLTVERVRAEELQTRLSDHVQKHADDVVHNPHHALHFVPYPERYTYFWNSNHKVAQWMRELGCDVRGLAFNSNWDVREPSPLPAIVP